MPSLLSNNDVNALLQQAALFYNQSQPQMAKNICEGICNAGIENPLVWCLRSAANIQLGLYEQALHCARRSSQIAPEYADAYYNMGAALYNLQRTSEAIGLLKKLIDLNPQHIAGMSLLGLSYFRNGNYEKAIESYQILLRKDPKDINIYCRLAETHERMNLLSEAIAFIEQALSMDPDHVESNAYAARFERINKRYKAAYQRLDRIRNSESIPRVRELILNELGLACDALGRYSEAFEAFRGCNTVTTARYAGKYNYKTFIDRINKYKSAINKESTNKWKRYYTYPDERKAPIFLLGFPRSGTTLTEQIIASHPSVYASDELNTIIRLSADLSNICPGVIDDYPFGLENLSQANIKSIRAEYWERVDDCIGFSPSNRRYLDKLPLNIVDLGFIMRIFPDAKIIFAVRDPRDVCLSCFTQCFESNFAMAAFEDLHSTAELYAATLDLWMHYRNVLDFDLHESRYEDLVTDFEINARKLIKFIGEPWNDSVLEFYKVKNLRAIRTPSYHDVSRPIYKRSIQRWRNYTAELQPVLPVLGPYAELLGYEQ